MSGPYDDIIHLPHHVSASRPQMSMSDRAAQFSPFAALTGYDDAIRETGRLTDKRIVLNEDELSALNTKYQLLANNPRKEVRITFFRPDSRKDGGAYVTATGFVRKIDTFDRLLYLESGSVIPMDDIFDIEFDCPHP